MIGRGLAAALGVHFLEGDDYHPRPNSEKMSRGEPLTDADRVPWLPAMRGAKIFFELSVSQDRRFEPPIRPDGSSRLLRARERVDKAQAGAPTVLLGTVPAGDEML
jgi:gluconokinase